MPTRAELAARERRQREVVAEAAARRSQRERSARDLAQRERDARGANASGSGRHRGGVVLASVALVLAGGAAYAGVRHFSSPGVSPRSPGGSVATTTAPRAANRAAPAAVGLARCTFIDSSRTVTNYKTGVTTMGRRLVTEVRYLAQRGSSRHENVGAPALRRGGGYPVVFFAEGFDVTPDVYAPLLDAWVRAGFVVVAPIFPDTNGETVAEEQSLFSAEGDNVNEPADMVFVTQQVLGAAVAPTRACRVLDGLVDPSRAVLAGQSDGGNIVAGLAYDSQFTPLLAHVTYPYRAVAVLSGAELVRTGSYNVGPGAPPMLVVQSDADQCNPPVDSQALYNVVPITQKWFLLLHGFHHLAPYNGRAVPAFTLVAAVTARWFRLELAGATPSAGFLSIGNRTPAVGTLTTGPLAPAVPALGFSQPACFLVK